MLAEPVERVRDSLGSCCESESIEEDVPKARVAIHKKERQWNAD